jgi:hypothetical protein
MKIQQPTKLGDIRRVTRFLFLPLTLENETYWMETATYTEQFILDEVESTLMGEAIYKWSPIYWGTPRCTHGYDDWDDCPDCRH